MPPLNEVLKTLINAVLGVLRWSQMAPMIVAWGFVLFAVLLALVLGFQEESIGVVAWLHETTAGVPGLHAWLSEYFETSGAVSETGGIKLTDEMLTPFFINTWLVLSFFLWAIGTLWHLVRGTKPGPQRPLRWKLGIATIMVVLTVSLAAFGLYVAGAAENVSAGDAAFTIGITAVLLWLVSAYSLTITHVIGKIQIALKSKRSELAV